MNNFQFIHNFIYSIYNEHRTYKNLSYRECKLYSYATVIGRKFDEYKILLKSKYNYNATTAKHLNYLWRATPSNWTTIECDTDAYNATLDNVHKQFIEDLDYIIKHNVMLKNNKYTFKYPTARRHFIIVVQQWQKLNKAYKKSKKVYKKYIAVYDACVKYEEKMEQIKIKRAAEARKAYIAQVKAIESCVDEYIKTINITFGESTYKNHKNIEDVYKNLVTGQKYTGLYAQAIKRYYLNTVYKIDAEQIELYNFYTAYFDPEKEIIKTTGSVEIENRFLPDIYKMLCIYFRVNPEEYIRKLLGKHVGPYTIIDVQKDFVKIGCHRLCRENLRLLMKDLEKRYANTKNVCKQ